MIARYKMINCKQCGIECKSGHRGLCGSCYAKAQKEREQINKKKQKLKEKKASEVSVKQLDGIFSKLIRSIYPEKCHGCGIKLPKESLQCCHFVTRAKYAFRWDMRNCLPGCRDCNFYRPQHVYALGIWINTYHEPHTAEFLVEEGCKTTSMEFKLSKYQKKELFDICKDFYARSLDTGVRQKETLRLELKQLLIEKGLMYYK